MTPTVHFSIDGRATCGHPIGNSTLHRLASNPLSVTCSACLALISVGGPR